MRERLLELDKALIKPLVAAGIPVNMTLKAIKDEEINWNPLVGYNIFPLSLDDMAARKIQRCSREHSMNRKRVGDPLSMAQSVENRKKQIEDAAARTLQRHSSRRLKYKNRDETSLRMTQSAENDKIETRRHDMPMASAALREPGSGNVHKADHNALKTELNGPSDKSSSMPQYCPILMSGTALEYLTRKMILSLPHESAHTPHR